MDKIIVALTETAGQFVDILAEISILKKSIKNVVEPLNEGKMPIPDNVWALESNFKFFDQKVKALT